MAMLFANAPRMFVIKARRETVVLVLAAIATTLALAHGLDNRIASLPEPDKDWVGNLAAVTPIETPQAEPMSSATLVVPKSQLALPPLPAKPIPHVKTSCDSADKFCAVRPLPLTLPPRRQVASLEEQRGLFVPPASIPSPTVGRSRSSDTLKRGLLGTLNPLNHLPDGATLRRPFVKAVRNWFKWL